MTHPDAGKCPPKLRKAIDLWVHQGEPPNNFLWHVLANDLFLALVHADMANLEALPHVVAYLHLRTPAECWGSGQRVRDWYTVGGLVGMPAAGHTPNGGAERTQLNPRGTERWPLPAALRATKGNPDATKT